MLLRNILWPAVLLPMLVAGTVVWLDPAVRRATTPSGDRAPRSSWGGALAFAAAYLAAHTAIAGWPPLPAVESSDWLAWLVVAAALGGIIAHTAPLPLADPVVAALLFLGLSATTMRPMLAHTWNRSEGAVALGLLAFALTVVWLTTMRLMAVHAAAVRSQPETPATRPAASFVLAAVLGFAGIALGLSATARLGMISGAAGFAAGTVGVVALLTRGRALPGLAAAPPIAVALVGLVGNGLLYADLQPLGAVALLAAPLAGLIGFRAVRTGGWRRTLVATAATALIAASALGLAAWKSPQSETGTEEYDPYA